MAVLRLDELNINSRRSLPFEVFFGEMELTEEQKRNRIRAAELFDEMMLALMYDIDMHREMGIPIDAAAMADQLYQSYLEQLTALSVVLDLYLIGYAQKFAESVLETTEKYANDPWFLSEDRAVMIAENEANAVYGHEEFEDAIREGYTTKIWVTMKDKRVRETHREVDEHEIPIDEPFAVGGSLLLYPKDETYDPDPEETVNCRCSIRFGGQMASPLEETA